MLPLQAMVRCDVVWKICGANAYMSICFLVTDKSISQEQRDHSRRFNPPIGGVQSYTFDLAKDIVISQSRKRNFLELGFVTFHNFDSFHRFGSHVCEMSKTEVRVQAR